MSTAAQAPTQNGEPSSAASTSASAGAIFRKLHPESYLQRYLAKDYRPDGRQVGEWRDVSVNTGSISTAHGSALVRMGNTTMVCGIKAEVAEPDSAKPTHGFIVPNIDLPALSSPRFKPGPPGPEAQVFSNWLNDMLISSQVIPLDSLCISPGKAVYTLYIDVVCINYDGNAFDAAVMAVMAALKNTRLPRAQYNPTTERTTCSQAESYPLALGSIPLSCSFGIFQTKYLLPDPTSFETPLLPTTITIALDEQDRAVLVRQLGAGGVIGKEAEGVMDDVWDAALERIRTLREILASTE